jgi:hypothetical protein
MEFNFIFSSNPDNPELVFVELEDENGYGIGEHPNVKSGYREDGYYAITITTNQENN